MKFRARHVVYVLVVFICSLVSVAMSFGQTVGTCVEQVSPDSSLQQDSSINDLGEVIWSQFDPVTGYRQIFSSTRGQLTNELTDHNSPSINNRGDVVWVTYGYGLFGLLSGQYVQLSYPGPIFPSINDNQDVVWIQLNQQTGLYEIYSIHRGVLISQPGLGSKAQMNNAGDVVWEQQAQIYRLSAGATTPDILTNGDPAWEPSISNSGEIVWYQFDPVLQHNRLYSNIRGQLTFDCPGGNASQPSVNSCGDVTFTNVVDSTASIYRLGNNAPCLDTPEPNNSLQEAFLINGNGSVTGSLQGPGDPEDWYRFTAKAGDPIGVNVNWVPAALGSWLEVSLVSTDGNVLATAIENGSLKGASIIAPYTGDYFVRIVTTILDRIGYNLSMKVGIGGGYCSDPAIPGAIDQQQSSINDIGEIVWAQYDPVTAHNQIYSSTRGQLTFDEMQEHDSPSVNNRGDVVWAQPFSGEIHGLIAGQRVLFASGLGAQRPTINDDREAVWVQYDDTWNAQVFSSRRGYLTRNPVSRFSSAINNAGDVVWVQFDNMSGSEYVYKLTFGSTNPVTISKKDAMPQSLAVSNAGEIVWSQGVDGKIWSSTRGQLTSWCPSGIHDLPSVNSCGDFTFTKMFDGSAVYRRGNSSPCISDAEPNDSPSQALLISAGTTTLGKLQEPGDPGDWYKFTAAAGETIRLNVNSLPTSLSGGFLVELNEAAGVLAVAQETGTLKTITVVANGSGVYYVHITALPGIQVGYALSLDILPAASVLFGFVDQINVPLNTVVVSNGIPISGISAPMPITITGGEYEINNSGLWTSTGGMVKNGDVVGVRQTSAFQYSTTTETVLDIGGVSGTFRVTTLADNPPPTVVITSPLSGLTNNNRPLLTYTASAGTVVVTVDGVVVSKVSGDVIDALVDGMHTVDVAVTDTSGRTGSASVTFTVDTLAPAVAISSPAAKLTNNETPLLSYTVSDGRVIVKVDGVVVNKVSGDLLDPIADGPHTVQVEATDAAGNVGISKVDFAVDTVPPAISINPVKSPKKDDDVTISGTREKGANIAVNVDTSAVVSPVLYKTETTWSCKIDGMVEGINTITAIAIDAAGNTASANVSILVK